MKKVTYEISAISCTHCVHTIKMELGDLPGVKAVEGDLATKKITIEYDAPADEKSIQNLLEEINYPVAK